MTTETTDPGVIRGGRPCKAIIDGDVLAIKHLMEHLAMAMTHAEIYSVEAFTESELADLLTAKDALEKCAQPWIERIEASLPGAFAARSA